MFKPKLLTTLKDYSWGKFRSDLIAGVVVGIVGEQGKGNIVYSRNRRLEHLAAIDFRRTLTEDWN